MSNQFVIETQARKAQGTADSRRLRHAGKVPAVLYGAGKDNEHFVINQNEIMHNLEKDGFIASILSVKTDKGAQQAILRNVQMHPYKPMVMHVDFQRIRASQAMTIKVPINLVGADQAPGLTEEPGILTQALNEIDVTCLPKDLPESLEIDVSEMAMGDSLHLTDLVMSKGVELNAFMNVDTDDEQAMHDANQPVVSIVAPRAPTVDVEEGEGEGEGESEGEGEGTEADEAVKGEGSADEADEA